MVILNIVIENKLPEITFIILSLKKGIAKIKNMVKTCVNLLITLTIHTSLTTIAESSTGHTFSQIPHPTHFSLTTTGLSSSFIKIASL